MGLLTQEDSTLYREYFKEMAKLLGISIEYIYPMPDSNEYSIHGEIQPKFSPIIPLNIIFESNPKIKTLKNVGWISEDSSDKPYIAYLPYDTPYIATKARIKIPPIGVNKEGRWFEINDITEGIEYPDAYMCKLSPIYNSDTEMLDYSETNHNYIEGDNQPDQNTTHNQLLNENLEEHIKDTLKQQLDDNINKNFKYLDI